MMLGLLCLSAKTLKLHPKFKTQETIFVTLSQRFLNRTLIIWPTKKNIINLTLKFKTFALWKTLKRNKKFRPGENICKYHIQQTCVQNYKNFSALNSKEMAQFLKWAKDVNTHFTKEDIEMANERCFVLSIF